MARPVNEDRQNSIELGLGTYTGAVHARCGTKERYVNGGGCIHCARIIATEQREARTYLRRHRAALDKGEEMVQEDLDAEARRQAGIDELM